MERSVFLGAILIGAISLAEVQPEYKIHDKIKGSSQILVNTEDFVRGEIADERARTDAAIEGLSTNITLDVESKIRTAAEGNTNYTDNAVGELQTYAVALIEALADNAREWAVLAGNKAEAEASLNATNYTDSVSAREHEEFVGTLNDKAAEITGNLTNYVDSVGGGLSNRIAMLRRIMMDIVGDDTNKTIRAISAEEVAKIVADAPESYDTLCEIADWILNDTTGAAQMSNDIADMKVNKADKSDVSDLHQYVDEQISNVYDRATGYLDAALSTYDVYGKAAIAASNTVANILRPQSLEFLYDGSGETFVTNAFIAPDWTVSPMKFTNTSPTNGVTQGTALLYGSSSLRNYSVLMEELPEDTPYTLLVFDYLKDTHKIYATPQFNPYDGSTEEYSIGWKLTADDLPCVITLREPEAGVLIVRRDKVASN